MTDARHSILGIPREIKHPDFYVLLGLDRRRFDPSHVERAFAERMKRLQAHSDPKEQKVVAVLKGELLRARQLLVSSSQRAAYDRELDAKRAAKVRRGLEETLARGPLTVAGEHGIVALGKSIGLTEEEARDALRRELARIQSEKRREKAARAGATLSDAAGPTASRPQRTAGSSPSRSGHAEHANRTRVASRTPPPPAGEDPALAATRPDRSSPLVGRTIDDKYEVVSKLGEGGMGAVFKARHKLLDKFVALKVVSPHLTDRPQVRERFLREAKAAMEFVHPNAVPLRDFGITRDGLLFMTQDFSPGKSLRAILDRARRLPPARALSLVRQCLLALGEAHRKGIVHRDMKPENILVETDESSGGDHARVCDFGIAKIADADATEGAGLTGGAVIGTPHYMAPEQAAGDKVDARADLYALGCVLYELLSGRKVFEAETSMQVIMSHVTQEPDAPSSHVGGLSPSIDELVRRALAKAPANRFQTAEEFALAIDALDFELPGHLAPARTPAPRRPGASPTPTPGPGAKTVSTSRASLSPVTPSSSKTPAATPRAPQRAPSGRRKPRPPRISSDAPPARRPKAPAASAPGTDLQVKFCDGCGGSIPVQWRERRAAKRVGTKLVCSSCYAPVHAGKACTGCFRPLGPGVDAVNVGGQKRVCRSCSATATVLRVCSGCEVLLPPVAFERGEALTHDGKSWCRDCHKARRSKRT